MAYRNILWLGPPNLSSEYNVHRDCLENCLGFIDARYWNQLVPQVQYSKNTDHFF